MPTLLTARYRLRGERVFGNLLVALASDLRSLATGTAPSVRRPAARSGAGLAVG